MSNVIEFQDPVWSLFDTDFFRPSENLEDGRDYFFDWRWRKLLGYLRTARGKLNPHETPTSIQNETDQVIIDAFIDIVHGDKVNPSVQWAVKTFRANARTSGASQLKAMLLSRAEKEAIATEMSARPCDVETFEKLFFDVTRYIDKQAYISSIFAPFQTTTSMDDASPASAAEAKERMWMMVGYYFGMKKLELIMYRPMIVSANDLKEIHDSMDSMMTMAQFDYATTMRTFGFARPTDFEKGMQYATVKAQASLAAQGQSTGNFQEFYSKLLEVGANNLAKLNPSKANLLMQGLANNDSAILDRAFGPQQPRQVLDTNVVDIFQPRRLKSARTVVA